MRLFGLDAFALSLAALVVGAILIALYLRKRPSQRVLVSSLALWLELADAPGAKRLARWRRSGSLLIALGIAGLLLGALADPRPDQRAHDELLWIDRGSAMSAEARLATAKRAAHARVDALGPGERAQIASFADHPSIHSALSDDRAALHRAIERIRASDAQSDGAAAAALGLKRHSVLFSSNRAFASDEFVRVGEGARNVGITQFRVRSYPLDRAHASCLVTIENFGPHRERLTLRIRSDVTLFEQTFELAPSERLTRTLEDLPGRNLTLEASISLATPDLLPSDDRATARLSSARPPRVLLVSAGDRYLEAALLVDPQLLVTRSERFVPGDYDVVVFDRTLPDSEPRLPALYLGPPAEGGYFPLERRSFVTRPFIDRVQASPLLTGLALRDVNISRALVTVPTEADRVLAADRTPLLIEGQRAAPFLALTFALRESDLGLRAAFPVLLLRAIDQLTGQRDALAGEAHGGSIAPHGTSHVSTRARTRWYWPTLAALALLALALEWLAYRRGWTS